MLTVYVTYEDEELAVWENGAQDVEGMAFNLNIILVSSCLSSIPRKNKLSQSFLCSHFALLLVLGQCHFVLNLVNGIIVSTLNVVKLRRITH